VEQDDQLAKDQINTAVREYYQSGSDVDDDAWSGATSPQSNRAWDED
jgi:hypothetical protein